ncbi:MAG: CADD family putative folate metabolism protein [Proteobacteria bacterium]|nr:CADD family putative folate metabolism protein [Pseudomonadota bacterium]
MNKINEAIDEWHLLKHSFYQRWNNGTLSKEELSHYAHQYYHHVEAFPRYISATHSNCISIKNRQTLLENLIDEERGDKNHPDLWLSFCKGLGLSEDEVKNNKHLNIETHNLIDGMLSMSKSSYEEGLGSLYGYESQVPEIAKSKIDGLCKHYNFKAKDDALIFFQVHIEADQWHREESANMITDLDNAVAERAYSAAIKARKLLWNFLDGVEKHYQ